ncbi:MAG TPA: CDP-diacylglycerol O-phosphatidyltransferase [Candidatus Binatia bacterium]|jgi:phosphatidylcholine synthase
MTHKLALAWLVHLYTALGGVVAFLTIVFIEQLKFREAFWLMALAVVIDATDGTLARAARVKEVIPWFDGDRLEDIIDYANYVIVPCWFFIHANLLPAEDALWLASLPLLASAYGFCQKEAKTSDNFFLGFPSYWNIIAFYLYTLQTPPWINAFTIIFLSVLVFVPIKYIYPSRSPQVRLLTNALGSLWGLAVMIIIYLLPEPPRSILFVSLLFPAYYTLLSLGLALRRVPS